jgi:hypothetical protein
MNRKTCKTKVGTPKKEIKDEFFHLNIWMFSTKGLEACPGNFFITIFFSKYLGLDLNPRSASVTIWYRYRWRSVHDCDTEQKPKRNMVNKNNNKISNNSFTIIHRLVSNWFFSYGKKEWFITPDKKTGKYSTLFMLYTIRKLKHLSFFIRW